MSRETIPIGRGSLAIPDGYDVACLSDRPPGDRLARYVTDASDSTVYHQPAYVAFARSQTLGGDVVFLLRGGNVVVGMPLYETAPRRFTTGYSGILFPDGGGPAVLRRGVAALRELAAVNRGLTFDVIQSAQSCASEDIARTHLLLVLLEGARLPRRALWTRVTRLPDSALPVPGESATFSLDESDAALLASHDSDARNQIRQAERHGVRLRACIAGSEEAALPMYERYLPLHRASWTRTGLAPHRLEYWMALSRAIREGGGTDFAVFAEAPTGEPVAAVTCHAFRDRAIYWSGASVPPAQPLRANAYCLHGAMNVARRLGVTTFELGRFQPTEGDTKERSITAYKRQFGGEVRPLPNVYRPSPLHRAADMARPPARRLVRRLRAGP